MFPVIGERRCCIVICKIFIANILSQYKWLWGWIQCFTHLPVICKFLSLNASVGTLQFNCGGTSSLMTHTTQRPESHGLGQKFEGWAGSMYPQENTWGLECPCIFCIWVPCPSRENPAHWILLRLLINMCTLSRIVRFSSCLCLWVVEPLLFVKVLLGSNHVEKHLVVTSSSDVFQ